MSFLVEEGFVSNSHLSPSLPSHNALNRHQVVASSLDRLQPVIFDSFRSPADLAECLAASANVPEVAGGKEYTSMLIFSHQVIRKY